jgi:signal transduction histidine kinase
MAEDLPDMTPIEIKKFALIMRNSASNLFSLLENLLQWSQMQQGLTPFSPQGVQLLPVINDAFTLMYEPAKNKGIELSCYIPANMEVFAVSNMLQSVMRNLVSNAVKFTPIGGSVSVSADRLADNSVLVAVKDTGIGMNRAMIENLFRLDVDTSRKGTEGEASTGLGLILCKDFIEKQGGQLQVESREGFGSTFRFTVPVPVSAERPYP